LIEWVSDKHFVPELEALENVVAQEDSNDLKINTVVRRRSNSTNDTIAQEVLDTI
jgi:hypothetical protein